ncbi:diphthamide biosynthesis protein 2 [Zalerion maritima]|uniref:2-(3-amino-3-carboxypropyl)histidine synthase subunit 2 n=1 Tax=Zalerion maritima TaxID=339359 RepID=A0AAD5RL74_9PEZI|nr:diphthamide biosynthesis protein 2 [Zalerion maritima]
MTNSLETPPVLSTPAEHTFEDPTPEIPAPTIERTEAELHNVYEISRTARDVRNGKWTRIALQFPDTMLCDAPWVVEALMTEIGSLKSQDGQEEPEPPREARLYILADTSYSACCVDEIAAEHVGADVVVHYGRSCLSPTVRLPVIYVFTRHALNLAHAATEFEKEIPEKNTKAIVIADVTYQDHVALLCTELQSRGYTNILQTQVVHNPKGKLPNRIISSTCPGEDMTDALDVTEYSVFHIATPPTALLLAISSRVKSFHILPTRSDSDPTTPPATSTGTRVLLRRRYAHVLTLASAGIIGILINTLSLNNSLPAISALKSRISAAGKKSYTVVVGKLNPAKLANFAEVEGWVVVGCWESGLVEGDGFYRPVITPFELDVALTDERERVWGGEWWGGIEWVEEWVEGRGRTGGNRDGDGDGEEGSDDEDEPPEFDLRTGKLVSKSRPMRIAAPKTTCEEAGGGGDGVSGPAKSLVMRTNGEVATIKGTVSPGAEYLRTQRTWVGLGSDYTEEASTVVEEGRSGIARGYTIGEQATEYPDLAGEAEITITPHHPPRMVRHHHSQDMLQQTFNLDIMSDNLCSECRFFRPDKLALDDDLSLRRIPLEFCGYSPNIDEDDLNGTGTIYGIYKGSNLEIEIAYAQYRAEVRKRSPCWITRMPEDPVANSSADTSRQGFPRWKVASWIQECHVGHAGRQLEEYGTSITGLRLIDTQKDCVVTCTPGKQYPYFALSYLWGDTVQLVLTVENSSRLAGEQSLSKESGIPNTIRSAIEFCRLMGKGYLWVDSL